MELFGRIEIVYYNRSIVDLVEYCLSPYAAVISEPTWLEKVLVKGLVSLKIDKNLIENAQLKYLQWR